MMRQSDILKAVGEGYKGERLTKASKWSDEQSQNSIASTEEMHSLASKPSQLAGKQTVSLSRYLVFIALLSTTICLSLLTYFIISREQMNGFHDGFNNLASEIVHMSQRNVEDVFEILESFSVATTSYALDTNAKWPFVTIPNFEKRGSTALRSSRAVALAFLPLVSEKEREWWETYSTTRQKWIQESYGDLITIEPIPENIWIYNNTRRLLSSRGCDTVDDEGHRSLKDMVAQEPGYGPYSPVWQLTPPPQANDTRTINYNLFDKPVFKKAVDFVSHIRKPVFLDVCNQAKWFGIKSTRDTLQTVVVYPIFSDFTGNSTVAGHLVAVIPWASFFENILQPNAQGINVVLENNCDEVFAFEVKGYEAFFLGEEDIHDEDYEHMKKSEEFAGFANPRELFDAGFGDICAYTISVYPTKSLQSAYINTDPYLYGAIVASIFIFTSLSFVLYDCMVEKIKHIAEKNEILITSLFPENVRERIMDAEHQGDDSNELCCSAPIADLFPEATVMFADISGFTAWSSVRAPEQVLTLLEGIYQSFDVIAREKGVFKVETIGDTYVSCAGAPEYRKDHAVVMALFASACLEAFKKKVRKLEYVLGPGTSDLKLRVGLHTGPITGGVLRGEKARFQLFGDTVNIASKVESTAKPNTIQISREMAELLREADRDHWIKVREDTIHIKGKGVMKTFWLNVKSGVADSQRGDSSNALLDFAAGVDDLELGLDREAKKLVEWNCSLLLKHLKNIVARRNSHCPQRSSAKSLELLEAQFCSTSMVVCEVEEIIELPEYSASTYEGELPPGETSAEVEVQLRQYIMLLASMYEDNAFHSFEHATHVTMSVSKLLDRIVAPNRRESNLGGSGTSKSLHDHTYTYGITSDPLTQFAVILAALMHDVEHRGVPNNILIKEDPVLGKLYENKSVAEQNSVDVAWKALMSSKFQALRSCIYCNEAELKRFRQLIVNSIMATDIFDKDLGALRKKRWETAFAEVSGEMTTVDVNRKATIVIEHLIQASDVAHTMQHWHMYQKWNTRLFNETYSAYLSGRTEKDPCDGWYEGEIWFFDNYVIPLAKKLKSCGVFGVSSDEYLNYAVANRREWEVKGKDIISAMKQDYK